MQLEFSVWNLTSLQIWHNRYQTKQCIVITHPQNFQMMFLCLSQFTLSNFVNIKHIYYGISNPCIRDKCLYTFTLWKREAMMMMMMNDDDDNESKDLFCIKVFSVVCIWNNLVLVSIIIFSFLKRYRSCRHIFLSKIIKNKPGLKLFPWL